jgi:hypothetical protein
MKWQPVSLFTLLLLSGDAGARERLTFGPEHFRTWDYPQGLVTIGDDTIGVRRFGEGYNAAANAGEFSSKTVGLHGTATVRSASNPTDAALIVDLRDDTWWQPSPDDPVENWWIELDLGRTVVADKLRLVFPDTAGRRPFSYFAVYTSPGVRVLGGDALSFTRINRPGTLNEKRVVEYDLSTVDPGKAGGQFLVVRDTLAYSLVRFVRFVSQNRPPDAALAEIEVETIGFNVATKVATQDRLEAGVEVWGGDVRASERGGGAEHAIDSDLADSFWAGSYSVSGEEDWRSRGGWWVLDLGSTFRINRLLWLPLVYGSPFRYGYNEGVIGCYSSRGFEFSTSTGGADPSGDPAVEGPFKYQFFSRVNSYWPGRTYFDFQFPAQPIRLILLRLYGGCSVLQLWVFHAEGYPAQVEFESPDMELGSGYHIATVEWDADTPPGTRIEVETQAGNGFDTLTRYYLTNGVEVTKAKYEQTKARRRGDIVEDQVRDATWSFWSLPQRFSGQEFLSPTPRRWLRAKVRLISDDPDFFPSLRSLTFITTEPVVASGVTGVIFPREAQLDSLQEFVYTLIPGVFGSEDIGFDRISIELPEGAAETTLSYVRIGGQQVNADLDLLDGFLHVRLPQPVRRDSVQIGFRTSVFRDPTVFEAVVSHSERPDEVQGVVPAWFGATRVFVPEIPARNALLRNVRHDEIFTPNGDGVNDEYQLRFDLVKIDRFPAVHVYRLDGQRVAELEKSTPSVGRMVYAWRGIDDEGMLVPPGVYLVQIRVLADARDEIVQRVVHVVY